MKDIGLIARSLGLRKGEVESHGRGKVKIDLGVLSRLKQRQNAKYILVSAITPTPLGEGKTVTTVGLSMALNRLKHRAACTLRQSSLGPLFGAKGSAAGGGAAEILPRDEVNLHFTGDTHAVGVANNLLVSFVENAIFHGNPLDIDPASLTVKRCLDVSDRSLRHIRYILKSCGRKFECESGFEITAATETMSVLSLSRDLEDMRRRLSRMTVAKDRSGRLIRARDIKADGMMAVVLKDAIKPNLVQTSEETPCLIHTGPFANVSIGTSSIIADRIALGLCDYVVTESGFGVDCGAEKFFDIKCRVSGFKPDVCVIVCSVRALKAQSGKMEMVPGEKIDPRIFKEDPEALEEGAANLKKHIENVKYFSVPVVVCINVFSTDTAREIEFIKRKAAAFGAEDAVESTAWADGSRGALGLARSVVRLTKKRQSSFRFLYESDTPLKEKIETVAKGIYGARAVDYAPHVRESLDFYTAEGFAGLPVCIAKTQFSLSHDEALKGAPADFVLPVKDVRLCSGAGFVLAFTSTMQTMPGLPHAPRGQKADIDGRGNIAGLS